MSTALLDIVESSIPGHQMCHEELLVVPGACLVSPIAQVSADKYPVFVLVTCWTIHPTTKVDIYRQLRGYVNLGEEGEKEIHCIYVNRCEQGEERYIISFWVSKAFQVARGERCATVGEQKKRDLLLSLSKRRDVTRGE